MRKLVLGGVRPGKTQACLVTATEASRRVEIMEHYLKPETKQDDLRLCYSNIASKRFVMTLLNDSAIHYWEHT